MTHSCFSYFHVGEERVRYTHVIEEEEFEDEEPNGFEGVQVGTDLDPQDETASTVHPWDPSENFFSYI